MAVAKHQNRFLGPYEEPGKGWRVYLVKENGSRNSHMFASPEEARSFIDSKGKQAGFVRPKKRGDGLIKFEAYSRQKTCVIPCSHAECRNGKSRQKYIGSFDTCEEADAAIDSYARLRTEATGVPIRLRVTAIYANGAERELREFPVTEDGLTGFETDDSEYIAFVARVDRTSVPVDDVINTHMEGAPF